eukprot:TRINITY_DN5888_c0_g1_i1.p1 TRINITY_DN5888_c0_g1~~TRINITY_DN5888_c0_g1_i1.p1  ORF type:complete len:133 (+),score=13.04 TRINITY_DN5888_c0_g1_i1:65-463(+)
MSAIAPPPSISRVHFVVDDMLPASFPATDQTWDSYLFLARVCHCHVTNETIGTSVGKKGKSKYSAEVVSPLGVQVVVEPMAFSTVAGESVAFTVTLKVLSPSKDKGFVFGSLTWKNGQYSVRSPIVVQPISL